MYFNWALCLAAKPNIDKYLVDTSEYQSILNELIKWDVECKPIPDFANCNFSKQRGYNIARESIIAYENMINIPTTNDVITLVAHSIDSCLQGSGICPGAVDKRAIFNWLITDVFPSAYHCKLPNFIYTIEFNIEHWTYFKSI